MGWIRSDPNFTALAGAFLSAAIGTSDQDSTFGSGFTSGAHGASGNAEGVGVDAHGASGRAPPSAYSIRPPAARLIAFLVSPLLSQSLNSSTAIILTFPMRSLPRPSENPLR